MTSTWSISASVVTDASFETDASIAADVFDDFWLPLPPPPLNKNDALNDALMSKSELMRKKVEQIIARAQAKVNEEAKKVGQLDNYVERYVLPAVSHNLRGRTTSSEFITDDHVKYEWMYGYNVVGVDDKPSTTTSKPTSSWLSKCLCIKPQVRY
jgi:hypothetical protein